VDNYLALIIFVLVLIALAGAWASDYVHRRALDKKWVRLVEIERIRAEAEASAAKNARRNTPQARYYEGVLDGTISGKE
jgi:hypothetical protein